ncbi:hypothetical protein PSTG_15870 [Puccinia striiformis f. sp. tritici PST-78]|uniref:Uncharacterized protein n=3 Tax=Puccinia striiformis TaxID=27350 RepID=A0A0L0UUJ1_9BASI|nr:hypothetical protein PSTG_15870 [Puccinia striiformis f. sp. tritici PST-78]
MFDALIWDGHMILADIFSIEILPPYKILIQYIHRCYSSPDNPNETPSRIYITSQENQQSNQNCSTHSSMEERETEDQSPVIDFVDSVSLDTPSFEPLTPVDITNEKVEPEGNISQNLSGEPESVLDLVEENQSFNMNSVENLPEESIITEDSSFRIDNNSYFPECLSQSEWEFQSILSKTSSLNLLETINPLDFIPEEPFLTNSEHQNYISPSLIPSSPALTNTLEISTIQSLDEENNVQKDPGKNLEPIIKSNSISQQESLCDPIHLSKFEIKKKDLQLTITPGRSLNSLKPQWNFLSGCFVLLLSLSSTVCSVVVDRAGLRDISVGSGLEGNQKGGLGNFFDSPVWGEPLGFAQLSDLKVKKKCLESPHRRKIGWCWYLFDTLGWLGWTWIWILTGKKQNGSRKSSKHVDRICSWGGRVSRALPMKGKVDKNFFGYRCWKRCNTASTHVFNVFGNGTHRTGCLLVLTLVLLLYFEIFQEINPIGSTFHTQALKSGRSAVLQLSPPSIAVRSHPDRADNNKHWCCVHRLQYISEENLEKKVLCSLLRKRHHQQTPSNDSKNTMELLDFHRIPRLDHLLDFCYYQPHYSDTSREQINTFSMFSSDHASEHQIACSERSINGSDDKQQLHISGSSLIIGLGYTDQTSILQTSRRKQDRHQVNVDETDHTNDFPNFDFYKLNAYKEINRLPADACNQFVNAAFDVR